jgi:hypothetical protein
MAEYFLNIYSVPYFLSSIVALSIAGLLIIKKRKNSHVQLLIITQILLATFSFIAGMATCSSKPEVWSFWYSLIPVTSVGAVTFLFHFSYVSFTNDQILKNRNILMIYILPLFFLGLYFLNIEHSVVKSPNTDLGLYGEVYSGIYSVFKPLYYAIIGLILLLTSITFFRMFRKSQELKRRKLALYFIFSVMIPLVGFVISVIFVEILYLVPHVQLGIVSLSISGAVIAYGILKHQLFDIQFIVKETFVYLMISVVLIGIFRLIELGLSNLISSTFFGGDLTARLIAAAIVAGMFFPLRGQAIKIGDKLFPKLTKSVKSGHDKNLAIYKTQLEYALADGVITNKEQEMLKALRVDLRISDKDHDKLIKRLTKKLKNQQELV